MPLHTAYYHYIACSAKVENLLQPVCTTVSNAGFGDSEAVISSALSEGWSRTANGKEFLCPLHTKDAVDKPAKAPRKTAPLQEQP